MHKDSFLKRAFSSRDELIRYLGEEFAEVVRDSEVSPLLGGRRAALLALAKVDPVAYARTRNALDGAVSKLSPYLRHGILTLAEVRDFVLARVHHPRDAEKFVNELGWRDYWQRLYSVLGEGVWKDRETAKTGHPPSSYQAELPADIEAGETGLACMDAFAQELNETGYLHNHARMWTAAYVVHWRKVRWQAGAAWFLRHLLDGDPASNNLSWQWVASTFSHKPYFFNRENLERFTAGKFCRDCPRRRDCPFDKSYEALEAKLFKTGRADFQSLPVYSQEEKQELQVALPSALFWMHGDGLRQAASGRALFVFDDELLKGYRISLKRLVFLYECLLELEVDITRGSVSTAILEQAHNCGASQIVTTVSPSPRFRELRANIERELPVIVLAEPPFVELPRGGLDLTRFSRYWGRVKASAMTVI